MKSSTNRTILELKVAILFSHCIGFPPYQSYHTGIESILAIAGLKKIDKPTNRTILELKAGAYAGFTVEQAPTNRTILELKGIIDSKALATAHLPIVPYWN